MKKATLYVILTAIVILALLPLMNVAKASGISVATFDAATGIPKDTFAGMEDVKIEVQSSHKPITIKVFDPDNVEVYSKAIDATTYDDTLEGITTKHGFYTIEASSPVTTTRKNFATVYFNVVPEAPLGTIGIAIVSFGAFCFYGLAKRRKTTSFKYPV